MAWRTVNISRPSKISLSKDRLRILQEKEFFIPLDDIAVLILESPVINLTAALLSKIAEHNIAVFTIDENHLPNGVLNGFHRHSRVSKVVQMQITWKEPFKKRLRQIIVKNKINNQAFCLKKYNPTVAKKLQDMAKKVTLGDEKNSEAIAAKIYFQTLFSKNFTRQQENLQNAALNYGYSILRGLVARSLVANGFLPCLGLFHCSELNAFNLADDVMEPFRPFVDKWVIEKIGREIKEEDLTILEKNEILKLLTEKVVIGIKEKLEKIWLLNAVELVVTSLKSASLKKNYHYYKTIDF